MYYLNNKDQLNSLISELRQNIYLEDSFSLKPQKFRELTARCMGFKSYAALVANLEKPKFRFYLEEDTDENFHQKLCSSLNSEPYGRDISIDKIQFFYDAAVDKYSLWDEERNYESLVMASESL